MSTFRKDIFIFIFFEIFLYIENITGKLQDKKYVLSPSGGKIFTLQTNVQLDLMLRRTEATWSFVIFQAHSKYHNTRVSSNPLFPYATRNIGPGASILTKLPNYMREEQFINFYIKSNSSEEYRADVISTPYSDGAPFPGGCCLTCNMDLDPNLYFDTSHPYKTVMTFYHANVYFKRNVKPISCDSNIHPHKPPEHYRLEYHVYQAFLEEGNLDDTELFRGLEMMSSPSTIKSFGTKVSTLKAVTVPKVAFDKVPGQGIIYNIIVHDPVTNTEAAYSPVHTYGCSFTSVVDNCHSVVSTVNMVFAVLGAIVALAMCCLGHRYFKLALFLGGLMNIGFIFYIILSQATNLSHTGLMLCSAGIGVLGGLLLFLLWWFTEYIRLCLLVNSLFLGFLAAGCLMFSSVGDLNVWQSDFNYGMIVIAVTIVVPFVMLPWPKLLSIVYTSIVSAYGVIIGIDTFIHTSMSYLVLNVVIRAIEPDYDKVIVKRPFQYKDVILSITWAVLAVLGIAVQYVLSRKRPAFAKSGYMEQKRTRKYYDSSREDDERTPILVNSQGYRTNDIC